MACHLTMVAMNQNSLKCTLETFSLHVKHALIQTFSKIFERRDTSVQFPWILLPRDQQARTIYTPAAEISLLQRSPCCRDLPAAEIALLQRDRPATEIGLPCYRERLPCCWDHPAPPRRCKALRRVPWTCVAHWRATCTSPAALWREIDESRENCSHTLSLCQENNFRAGEITCLLPSLMVWAQFPELTGRRKEWTHTDFLLTTTGKQWHVCPHTHILSKGTIRNNTCRLLNFKHRDPLLCRHLDK